MSDKQTTPLSYANYIHRAADHLYAIHGDVTPEQYHAISQLRQLINECYKPEKLVTNQFIYDQLKEVL